MKKGFGTAPVFFTAISTILGAILFLRFGWAVGTSGFWGVVLIILLGHVVTIPTAFAISEIATNKRVEGGGEYFIISRSFGLNIGGTIGIALFFSQAISVAFYVIAFTEAFEFIFRFFSERFSVNLPRQLISIPAMIALSVLIIKRGAGQGVKVLYLVVGILIVSLVMFFLGTTDYARETEFSILSGAFRNTPDFFRVFAIIFPAFTGMTAGVGLSGDLRNPSRSIPLGTTLATFSGMIIYFFIVYKLAISVNPEELTADQLIMAKIALGGSVVIPLGLAASTLSSALGSVMVAPRTLQALAKDRTLPSRKLNKWLSRGKKESNEPVNASLVTCIIALVFVALGNVDAVATVISMFFMVTYGTLCLISFLNHFGSSPSYRPSFRSRWYISLTGFLASVWIMFQISTPYAIAAIVIMIILYLYINSYHKERKGLVAIFINTLFQLNRNLQVYLQKAKSRKSGQEWRPSAICISADSFERDTAFKLLNWISFRYGFGTYMHLIQGYYSRRTYNESQELLQKLIKRYEGIDNHVYVDTLISPSYTSAIAQTIQIPGVSGMENNMIIFEYDKDKNTGLEEIVENFSLVNAGNFDTCICGSTSKQIIPKSPIHIWIRSTDADNSNLMILLGFIILGHPDWRRSRINIFEISPADELGETTKRMKELVLTGRLPITEKNIQIIPEELNLSPKTIINNNSAEAGLTLIGFRGDHLRHSGTSIFTGYDKLGNVLFVNSQGQKVIN